jgi:hypothetical protein
VGWESRLQGARPSRVNGVAKNRDGQRDDEVRAGPPEFGKNWGWRRNASGQWLGKQGK